MFKERLNTAQRKNVAIAASLIRKCKGKIVRPINRQAISISQQGCNTAKKKAKREETQQMGINMREGERGRQEASENLPSQSQVEAADAAHNILSPSRH